MQVQPAQAAGHLAVAPRIVLHFQLPAHRLFFQCMRFFAAGERFSSRLTPLKSNAHIFSNHVIMMNTVSSYQVTISAVRRIRNLSWIFHEEYAYRFLLFDAFAEHKKEVAFIAANGGRSSVASRRPAHEEMTENLLHHMISPEALPDSNNCIIRCPSLSARAIMVFS